MPKKRCTIVIVTVMILLLMALPASAAITTVYLDDPQNAGTKVSVQFSQFVSAFLDDPTQFVCQVWARSSKKGVRADGNVVDFNAYAIEFLTDPISSGSWESYGQRTDAVLMPVPETVKELSETGIISDEVRNSDHIFQQILSLASDVSTLTYDPIEKTITAVIKSGHENDTLVDLLDINQLIDAVLVPGSTNINGQEINIEQNLDGVLDQLLALKDALNQLAGQTSFDQVKLSDLVGKSVTSSDRGTTVTLTLTQ